MADASLEITVKGGARQRLPVRGDVVCLGSGADAELRLPLPQLLPRHLRFVRTDRGYRVEPVAAGTQVEVNGERLFCKDLADGDELAVAGLRLRWSAPPAAAAAAAAAAPRRAGRGGERPARPRRRRGAPTSLWAGALLLAVLGAAVAVYRTLSQSAWPQTPQHYVDLAREQLGNRQWQRALDTLAFALREASGPTRAEALQLRADIERLQLQSAELPKVIQARQEHDLLLAFADRWLRDAPGRPAARELVREADAWLGKHAELCRRHDEGRPLVAAVEALRSRHAAVAALGEPDTAADVAFAAEARLRFQWRDYRGAMQRLDAFLAAHPDAAELRQLRGKLLAEGEVWLRSRLRNFEVLLGRGDLGNAEQDLASLERWSLLPEWEPLVAPLRARLRPPR